MCQAHTEPCAALDAVRHNVSIQRNCQAADRRSPARHSAWSRTSSRSRQGLYGSSALKNCSIAFFIGACDLLIPSDSSLFNANARLVPMNATTSAEG